MILKHSGQFHIRNIFFPESLLYFSKEENCNIAPLKICQIMGFKKLQKGQIFVATIEMYYAIIMEVRHLSHFWQISAHCA